MQAPRRDPARRFTCPVGPSVNNLYLNSRGHGRLRSPDYRRWLHEAGWLVKLQNVAPVPGLVAVLIEAPLSRRRDLDNALKPVLDLLVQLAIIENDNLIDDLRIVRAGTGNDMVISLWPM